MDKYNVIDQFDSLEDLELDMRKWINLPYEFRMRSDEECIRQHDCTNITLYNNLKAKFIEQDAAMTEAAMFADMTEDEKMSRFLKARELNASPYIAIISPDHPSVADLDNLYTKYVLLNDKDKRISNSYSLSLWGMNVPNMYQVQLAELRRLQFNDDGETIDSKMIVDSSIHHESGITDGDTFVELYTEKLDELYLNNCTSEIYSIRKSLLKELNETHSPYTRKILDKIILEYQNIDFKSVMPQICPWYTESEIEEMDCNIGLYKSYNDYRSSLVETINRYKRSSYITETMQKEIYDLAWSPYGVINKDMDIEQMMEAAKEKQTTWLKANIVGIDNISKKYNENNQHYQSYPVTESDDENGEGCIFIASNGSYDYDHMSFAISFTADFATSYLIHKNECIKLDGIDQLASYIPNAEIAAISNLDNIMINTIKEKINNIHGDQIQRYIPMIINLLLLSTLRKEYNETKAIFYTDIVYMLAKIAEQEYNHVNGQVKILYSGQISVYKPVVAENVIIDYFSTKNNA